ncbi:alginate export family protein [Pseudokordiimonas caeni]|uniref:alginate export family protein n=1 Tax=Pseudokordiimonas caeni TaxID=2997908 RepID=UPI002810FDAC|nr:alginate export family protein [Pseudokordiimonas caeni]
MKAFQKYIGASVMIAVQAPSAFADDITDFFKNGDAGLDLRYRLEAVDQDGLTENATASTLLTKLWFKTANVNGFSGHLEATNVAAIGGAAYNSTVNGKSAYPVVPDPTGTEVNQAWASYKSDAFEVRAGRQGINFDDQRFIGTVGWRQNDQTYDSAAATVTTAKGVSATYAYVWNVNRIFGNDHPLGNLHGDTHLFNASYAGWSYGKLTAYGYLLDFDAPGAAGLSSKTLGIRFAGSAKLSDLVSLGYQIEYARQSDHGANPADYAADFWHVGASVSGKGLMAGLDYELLGADSGAAFQTPLATLHKFNGWADKFLSTPVAGLKDIYATLGYKVPGDAAFSGTSLLAVYHEFKSDTGDTDYGSEWDFQVEKQVTSYLTLTAKAAFYNADGFATDTTKFWLVAAARF